MQTVKKGIDLDLFFIVIQMNNFYKQTVLKSYILIATVFTITMLGAQPKASRVLGVHSSAGQYSRYHQLSLERLVTYVEGYQAIP